MVGFSSIAVAQTCPIKGDVQANIDEHLQLVDSAAAAGAQILVFPELSLTGYELGLAEAVAFLEEDPRLSPLIEAAASFSTILIVGAPVRLGERLYIGAFILYPDRTVSLYTKHHLGAFGAAAAGHGAVPPAEATVFHPGDRNPLAPLGETTAAVAICADIGRPSHPRQAAARGARVYLASMFAIPSEFDDDAAKLQGYATQHAMTVGLANFGSPTGGLAAAGRSSIWSATGALLIQLPAKGAGVAVATQTCKSWRARQVMLS